MAPDVASLPREPDVLIGMIVELRDENGKLRAMLETVKRALYGARSEKFDADPARLSLGRGDVSTTPAEPAPDPAKPRSQDQPTRRKPIRNIGALPQHLPREDVVIEPGVAACPCCQCSATTRRCRYWIARDGERGSPDCGAMPWMTGAGRGPRSPRWSTAMPRIAAAAM